MTGAMLAATLVRVALFAVAGLALGAAYFLVLRRTVEVYLSGRQLFVPAFLTVARIAGAIVLLVVAGQFGAMALLAAFLGFLGARTLALRTTRRIA
jgi:hypothetical protein